jgi:hypothetical protein
MDLSTKILSDITVYMKYAKYIPELQRRETWEELVTRNKEMHIKKFPNLIDEIEKAYELVYEKKVLPSMRSLQFGGKPIEISPNRIFNCFGVETEFITSEGLKSFNDFKDGDEVTVLTHKGLFKKAVVRNYGNQQLNIITFKRGKSIKKIRATANHRWILFDGTETLDLQINQPLYPTKRNQNFDYNSASPMERLYWCYGYVFGDGSILRKDGEPKYSMVRLCGDEAMKYLYRFKEMGFESSEPNSIQGDIMVYTGKYLKTAPSIKEDGLEMVKAFMDGYLCADAYKNPDWYENNTLSKYKQIQSSDLIHQKFLEDHLDVCGYYITNKEDLTGQITNYGERPETYKYSITNNIGSRPNTSWSASEIKETHHMEPVWCLEVEDDKSFVLGGGIVTGNCAYLPVDDYRAFSETMFLLLGGTGVGFSVQKHHVEQLPEIRKPNPLRTRRFLVGDSIEGWADAIKILMRAYFEGLSTPEFDYSDIRQKGALLVTSGGRAPGPQPLKDCIHNIKKILDTKEDGSKLQPIEAHDIVCLHHDNLILLADGSWEKIGNVVKNKLDCEVMSFNEDTNSFEPKKITGWYKNKYEEGDWKKIHFEHQRNGKHGVLGGWFTHNHKMLTKEGYKEIQDLTNNDYINIGEYGNDTLLEQMILGSTLGDGSIIKQGTAYFVTSHTDKQKEYVDYIAEILSNRDLLGNKFSYERNTVISERKYNTNLNTVRSKSTYAISELYNYCYVDGVKSITEEWLKRLNPIGLAFWYMDDGSLHSATGNRHPYITFSTYNLSYSDVEKISNMLLNKFNISSVIDKIEYEQYSTIHYRLRLNVENTKKFISLISKYIPKCMRYKISNDKIDTNISDFELDILNYEKIPLYLRVLMIESMDESNARKYKTSYCIDVEDNHNFKTMSGIAHNCFIADAVLTGGIRRAALISLFSMDDEEMLSCKSGAWWELNPQRGRANNSAVILRHKITEDKFLQLWKKIEDSGSGEPGVYFSNDKDYGTNPCCEIGLRPFQFCNLCEVNVSDIISQEDLEERVKAASFIGTLQASYTNFHYLRDIWRRTTEKEALIGVGMTGIGSGEILKYDLESASKVVLKENARVAKLIGVNKAARATTVKPSGCVVPETKIITNKGILSLEEIFKINGYNLNEFKDKNKIFLGVNDDIKVKDKDNKWQQIDKLFINGVEETYDIEFEDGLVVSVTGNHKFLTKNRDWVRADELTIDDDIIDYNL